MKIYIHCGYHKTGSSFIQTMLSINRESLKEKGFYYPSYDRDKLAIQGKISPGNGLEFALAFREKDESLQKASNILKTWIDEANKINCDNLIISNEGLFHSFADIDFQLFFRQIINEFSLEKVSLLLFLRDPLDHIFSLYKHRGKRGTIPNFKDWVEQKYETLETTARFFNGAFDDSHIDFSFRKYKNDSQYLSDSVFKDWLGIPTPSIPKRDRVNASLSLSEIMVLENVYKVLGREMALKIQKRFMENSSPKPKEINLKTHYAYQINSFLNQYLPLIEKLNQALPKNESLIIENQNPPQESFKFATLSGEQLGLIIKESSLKLGLKHQALTTIKVVYSKLRRLRK